MAPPLYLELGQPARVGLWYHQGDVYVIAAQDLRVRFSAYAPYVEIRRRYLADLLRSGEYRSAKVVQIHGFTAIQIPRASLADHLSGDVQTLLANQRRLAQENTWRR